MFAIAFDLVVADTRKHHPAGVSAAYGEIATTLRRHDFQWIQGSVYLLHSDDMGKLMMAMDALRALPWLPHSVRDIRGFRVELWSDFTPYIKNQISTGRKRS